MDIAVNISDDIIETERLILRAWRKSDLDDFYEYASVSGVGELAGWKHHESKEVSRKILDGFIADKNVFAVFHKEDKKVIGSVGLHSSWVNGDDVYNYLKAKEIGYVLSRDYWGREIMPEAVMAVIRYLFAEHKLDAVTCGHFIKNERSRRVIEKCGFQFVKNGSIYVRQLQVTMRNKNYILFMEEKL